MSEKRALSLVQNGIFAGNIEEPDWTLLDVVSESQDRVFERFIRFDQRFPNKPVVHLSLVLISITRAMPV